MGFLPEQNIKTGAGLVKGLVKSAADEIQDFKHFQSIRLNQPQRTRGWGYNNALFYDKKKRKNNKNRNITKVLVYLFRLFPALVKKMSNIKLYD